MARKRTTKVKDGEFAPEHLYPGLRTLHAKVKEDAQEQFNEGLNMSSFEHHPVDLDNPTDACKIVAYSDKNVYIAGTFPVGPRHTRHYKVRVPRTWFAKTSLEGGEIVNPITAGLG